MTFILSKKDALMSPKAKAFKIPIYYHSLTLTQTKNKKSPSTIRKNFLVKKLWPSHQKIFFSFINILKRPTSKNLKISL
jgi:hypothetical protein